MKRQALDGDAQAVCCAALLEPGLGLALKSLAVLREQVHEMPAGNQGPQHRLGCRLHDPVNVLDLEQVHLRRVDLVADGRLHLDQVVLAGDHQRLLGQFLRVLAGVRAVPRQGRLVRVRRRAETDLHRADAVGLDAHHAVDGPRPAVSQARLQHAGALAETQDHSFFVGADLRESAQRPARQQQQDAAGQDAAPLVADPVQRLVQVEVALRPLVQALEGLPGARQPRPFDGPLKPQEPHRIEEHRQRSELVVNHAGERT